jgi:hypothetical protein
VKTNHVGTLAAGALVAVGLLVLMLVVEARPAEATIPGKNGKIAYAADDGTSGGIDSEIYTINPTGGTSFNVTNNDTDDGDPDYSPGGTKIAYSVSSATNPTGTGYEIYTINVGGGVCPESPSTIRPTPVLRGGVVRSGSSLRRTRSSGAVEDESPEP